VPAVPVAAGNIAERPPSTQSSFLDELARIRHLEGWSAPVLSRNPPMSRRHLASLTLALVALTSLPATANAQVKSGPQAGEFLPGSFAPLNLNGPSKGQYHSLVCEHGLRPTVLVFLRDGGEGPNPAALELLKKLDEIVPKHQAVGLKAFVVFLSADARSSVFVEKTEDVDKVLLEEERREKLRARLEKLAEPFQHVVVTAYPAEGPPGYDISPKAEVTVILYERLKVTRNWSFGPGEIAPHAVQQVLEGIDKALRPPKKESAQARATR
jgi:hypothetical protein